MCSFYPLTRWGEWISGEKKASIKKKDLNPFLKEFLSVNIVVKLVYPLPIRPHSFIQGQRYSVATGNNLQFGVICVGPTYFFVFKKNLLQDVPQRLQCVESHTHCLFNFISVEQQPGWSQWVNSETSAQSRTQSIGSWNRGGMFSPSTCVWLCWWSVSLGAPCRWGADTNHTPCDYMLINPSNDDTDVNLPITYLMSRSGDEAETSASSVSTVAHRGNILFPHTPLCVWFPHYLTSKHRRSHWVNVSFLTYLLQIQNANLLLYVSPPTWLSFLCHIRNSTEGKQIKQRVIK